MSCRKLALVLLFTAAGAQAADPIEQAATRASAEYVQRLEAATAELAATRARIEAARSPLAEAARQAEVRLHELEEAIQRLETAQESGADQRQQLRRENDEARRSLGYVIGQAQETLKAVEESLLPGERPLWAERIDPLRRQLESTGAPAGVAPALAAAGLAVERLTRQIGGHTGVGQAVVEADNRIVPGTFLFLGPEVFFQGQDPAVLGSVAMRAGGEWPTVRAVAGWDAAAAGRVFQRGGGAVALDASDGKALALTRSAGSFLDEVRKGGVVGLVILGVGALALVIAIQKLLDFRRLAVDEPPAVRRVLGLIASGAAEQAGVATQSLRATTRELFGLGLRHRHKPRAVLEEHLESYVLQQRMLQERRLPLLAVIATSGPLLGLLGTVTGMIKTFTLIAVFGTGSAGKLSAGISEALVATKFGLMVAIPALVVHGFLSQRIQKQLSTLERHALELATACEDGRRESPAAEVERV